MNPTCPARTGVLTCVTLMSDRTPGHRLIGHPGLLAKRLAFQQLLPDLQECAAAPGAHLRQKRGLLFPEDRWLQPPDGVLGSATLLHRLDRGQ